MIGNGQAGTEPGAARERLGERAWEEATDEGRAMSSEETVSFVFEGDAAPA